MGLFNFFGASNSGIIEEETACVKGITIPKYVSKSKLPTDLNTLYRMGRYYCGYSDNPSKKNDSNAFNIYSRLLELDENREYMIARKRVGRFMILGCGTSQNIKQGSVYYNEWIKYVVENETDIYKIDSEIREYFSYGFHNYAYLLDCAENRIKKEPNADIPVGMALYQLFLPMWLYSSISQKHGFCNGYIYPYLRFVRDNMNVLSMDYFVFNPVYTPYGRLKNHADSGNLLALYTYAYVTSGKNYTVNKADLQRICDTLRMAQEKHNYEARHQLKANIDKKLELCKDLFYGPRFEIPQNYPFQATGNAIINLYPKAEQAYRDLLAGLHSKNHIKLRDNFFAMGRVLYEQKYAPIYFLYANLYAKTGYSTRKFHNHKRTTETDILDEELVVTEKQFYEKAKAAGYPPAVNLEKNFTSDTLALAADMGFKKAVQEKEAKSIARDTNLIKYCMDTGNYREAVRACLKHTDIPARTELDAVLNFCEQIRKEYPNITPFYNPDREYEDMHYFQDMHLLTNYDEPYAYYILSQRAWFNKDFKAQYNYICQAISTADMSFWFGGKPVPDNHLEHWKKIKAKIRL